MKRSSRPQLKSVASPDRAFAILDTGIAQIVTEIAVGRRPLKPRGKRSAGRAA